MEMPINENDKAHEVLFEKILDVYGELRIQCDADYRGRVFEHSHRLIRKYGGPKYVSEMRLMGFEGNAEDTQESHAFAMKMVDVFGGEFFIGESLDKRTTIALAEAALKQRGFTGVSELELVGIREIIDGDMDEIVFGRVPDCMIEEQRAKKLHEQVSKILKGYEELQE